MRITNRVCIMAVLLMAGLASANTVWTPQDPNAAANGYSDWKWTNGTQTNWSLGIPVIPPAPGDPKAVLGSSTIECRVTSMTGCGTFSMGDGTNAGSKLRIVNGATLYTTQGGSDNSWSAIGYSAPATMIVEEGGTLQIAGRLGIGWFTWAGAGQSELLVNGGYVKVGANGPSNSNLQLGSDGDGGTTAHKGYINVTKGGLIEVNGGLNFNNSDGSNINLEFGSIVFSTNVKTLLDSRITDGKVKGFGGLTAPTAVYASGKTTLSAPDPMNRNPVYTAVLAGSTNLTWTNMAPIAPATDVWVDVWFGTDPNKLGANYTKVLSKGKNATTVTVDAPLVDDEDPTTYYWQVDSYLNGDPAIIGDPNVTATGLVTLFEVVSDTPPSVDPNTPRTATWINEQTPIKMIVTDNSSSAVTVTWSAADTSGTDAGPLGEPNVVFTPAVTVLPAGTTYPYEVTTSMVCNYHAAQMTVTATVEDDNPLEEWDSAFVALDCAEDACQATTGPVNSDALHKGDAELDCQLNLLDFAAFARNWLDNYQLQGPVAQ